MTERIIGRTVKYHGLTYRIVGMGCLSGDDYECEHRDHAVEGRRIENRTHDSFDYFCLDLRECTPID